MNKDELYSVVSNATTSKLYPDFVPKNAPLPALSYTHNSNGKKRIIKGV